MVSLATPLWLFGLITLPLIRWLHRFSAGERTVTVAALFLWRQGAAAESSGERRGTPDPRWRLRALIVTALLLALAGPALERSGEESVEIWLDDSLSMQSIEQGETRLRRALERIEHELTQSGASHALVHSLTNPGLQLSWTADGLHPLWQQWSATSSTTPLQPPAAALMERLHPHWLATDGADTALNHWAAGVPLSRIIQSGSTMENGAITRLAARPDPEREGEMRLIVTLFNPSPQPLRRTLTLRGEGSLIHQEEVELPAASSREIPLQLAHIPRQELQAEISPADALTADDSLSLGTATLTRVDIAVGNGCPAPLVEALRSHPRLRTGKSGTSAAMRIVCDGSDAAPDLPALVIHTGGGSRGFTSPLRWLESPGSGRWPAPPFVELHAFTLPLPATSDPLLVNDEGSLVTLQSGDAKRARRVDTLLDLSHPALIREPAYPLIIDSLIGATLGRSLLDESASASRDASESRIAPQPLPFPAAPPAPLGEGRQRPLAPLFILLALLLLSTDLLLARRSAALPQGGGR